MTITSQMPVVPVPRPGPPDDHDLMLASMAQPEVFAEIFDRHAPAIHRYLSRRVGELADDLVGETFLTAFRRRDSYRPDRVDVRPWLYGIAANLLRRHQRDEVSRYRALARSAGHAGPAVLDHLDDTHARMDAQDLGPALATALADLDPREREVLLLVAWGDLTYSEVAAVQEVPVGTVRSRLHRARQRVQQALADRSTQDITEGGAR